MVKLLQPHDRILLVTASTVTELGRMFVRPQEFYESPSARFRGKFFTLDSFKRYYRKRWGCGAFSYYADFGGYNMPGEVFLDWQKTFAGNETEDEQKLLGALGAMPGTFYLIGALESDVNTIDHELSHAFFHLFLWYRALCVRRLRLYDLDLEPLRKALRRIMYREEVMDDECISYVLFEKAWMRRQGVAISRLEPLRRRLNDLYEMASANLRIRSQW